MTDSCDPDLALRAPYPPRLLIGIVVAVLAVASAPAGAQTEAQVQDVEESLAHDSSYKVRVEAALVLGRLHQVRSIPVLTDALRDPPRGARQRRAIAGADRLAAGA